MSKLNGDVLYLIFMELQYDKNTLYSCLSVNKTWCQITIPILWKNPWKYFKRGEELLLNVILSHLPEKIKNNLKDQGINLGSYQRPLFNYLSFCRHLNLNKIDMMTFKLSTIRNEIFSLFINENTKFTHLYISHQFNNQINLIPGAYVPHQFNNKILLIPGTKNCFSELEFLSCDTSINDSVLVWLMEICNSIKELELSIDYRRNNLRIAKLIKTPKKLFKIRILTTRYSIKDESFYTILDNSLIKHANTFVYLKSLELLGDFHDNMTWNCLGNSSLPFLEILNARKVPIKILTSLIENTSGHLIEINIYLAKGNNDETNKRIIQAIYQNCPDLMYLKLLVRYSNSLEFEKILTNCQYLCGLIILTDHMDHLFDWDNLFEILVKSSPICLFKFKFYYYESLKPKLTSLKLFFDSWKGRNSMLLHINYSCTNFDLLQKYKVEGIIKNFDYYNSTYEDFEWVQKNL